MPLENSLKKTPLAVVFKKEQHESNIQEPFEKGLAHVSDKRKHAHFQNLLNMTVSDKDNFNFEPYYNIANIQRTPPGTYNRHNTQMQLIGRYQRKNNDVNGWFYLGFTKDTQEFLCGIDAKKAILPQPSKNGIEP